MAPFSVTVPPGVLPGQALHVQIGGHVVAVQVPPGTAPGAVLSIEVDLPGTQPQRPPRELAPPPEPAPPPDGTTGSCEKIFVVVATIFGFKFTHTASQDTIDQTRVLVALVRAFAAHYRLSPRLGVGRTCAK